MNGQKVWTSHADIADWCFLLCRTEPDAPKHKGISLLLVDMKTPGITVRPLRQMTDDAEFCEVFFEDVRVPADHLLGAPGAGWSIAMGIVAHERGPMWTFVFQRKIRRSLDAADPARRASTRRAAARCATRWCASGSRRRTSRSSSCASVGYRSLTTPAPHRAPRRPESSLEKVLGSETDQRLQDLALELFGPYGGAARRRRRRSPAAASRAQFLYARSETIMGGTSEIQRNVIAQRILGLPR